MVAVRTSDRCTNCRRKKIKCDEKWPSCSACQRAELTCPGPARPDFKFMHYKPTVKNGSIIADKVMSVQFEQIRSLQMDIEGVSSLVPVREMYSREGEGKFIKFRFNGSHSSAAGPGAPSLFPSQSLTERTCSELLWVIGAGLKGEMPNVGVKIPWIDLVPQRLANAPVLEAAVNLFLVVTINKVRDLPFALQLDRKSYNRSIQLLRSNLMKPECAFSTETLAALFLLSRVESDHEQTRGPNQSLHAQGLRALLAAKGPPKLSDPLDVQISFDSIGVLFIHFLISQEEFFYTDPRWLVVMKAAAWNSRDGDDRRKRCHQLDLIMIFWPAVVQKLNAAIQQKTSFVSVLTSIEHVRQDLTTFQRDILNPLFEDGTIKNVTGASDICSTDLHFSDWWSLQTFLDHAFTSLAMSRITSVVEMFSGKPTQQSNELSHYWSEKIWQCLGYTRFLSRDQQDLLLGPIVLSYESADCLQRQRILAHLRHIAGPRGRFLASNPERAILATCFQLTGRWLEFP